MILPSRPMIRFYCQIVSKGILSLNKIPFQRRFFSLNPWNFEPVSSYNGMLEIKKSVHEGLEKVLVGLTLYTYLKFDLHLQS